MPKDRFFKAAAVVAALTAAGFALHLNPVKAQAPAAGSPPPPPEVGVLTIAPERLAITSELPGRLEPTRISQVRARVPGIVLKKSFKEGADIKAGTVLFQIDPEPFRAVQASAQAALSKAEANLAQANLKVQRYKPLVETNAISRQEFDDALTQQQQANADIATAKANLRTANLNLGYATVTAPISGRIGRALITEGALVGQGEATPMAIIHQIDPIYVTITQPSVEVLRLRQALQSGQLKSAGQAGARVTLVTEDGRVHPQPGRLLFSDLTVDESTGAMSMRAEFPNPERSLLPGMYVRARLEQAINEQAIALPQQAVLRSAAGASVLLVGADGKVASQPVTVDGMQSGKWMISKGLKAGDRVIVEGFQKTRPGGTVKPMPWQDRAAAGKPAGGAPAGGAPAGGAPAGGGAPAAPATPAAKAAPSAKSN